jgi:hypothetical protein
LIRTARAATGKLECQQQEQNTISDAIPISALSEVANQSDSENSHRQPQCIQTGTTMRVVAGVVQYSHRGRAFRKLLAFLEAPVNVDPISALP